MNLITLFVTLCLISDPTSCKDHEIQFTQTQYIEGQAIALTPFNCMMTAQSELAKFMVGHPKEKVAKFSCKYPKETKRT